jgi:hypothetical protein
MIEMVGVKMSLSKSIIVAGVLAFSAGVANAATTAYCPEENYDGTVFSLTADSGDVSCVDWGDEPNGFEGIVEATLGVDLILLDKSDDGDSGLSPNAFSAVSGFLTSGSSGAFNIILEDAYDYYVAIFKTGGGQNSPSWAAFSFTELPVDDNGGFTWAISGQNGLSHVELFGVGEKDTPEVPLPAAGFLLLGGLGGLMAMRRRKS